ncbi:hypothetical protein HBI16_006950 [Parastagonospora nodorum]|nr:hypothetical protein HBI16_006950 [Parastagonospora nodorum]
MLNLASLLSLTALLNLRSLALKRPALSGSDLNCGPLLAKRIKTNEDCKKSTHRDDNNVQLVRDNIEKLISENNRNNLNIMVTNPTGREFSRVDMKSLTRLCLLIDKAKAYDISKFYKELIPGELGSIYVLRIVSKSDKVPTRELSSYIKIELLRDNSCKFYRLVITSKDTHYKQIIKKAYIMLLERALLILFMT